jgi:hypothetical protein
VIFGGYGRKAKLRGEVFYPCTSCSELNTFGLVESYNYGQLYGVRLAKYKTQRAMMCSKCRSGYELDENQWKRAVLESKNLQPLLDDLTMKEMAQSAVMLGRTLFGTEGGQRVRGLLWQQLEEDPPFELADTDDDKRPSLMVGSEGDDGKTCPDCAETVKAAARKCRYCGHQFEETLIEGITLEDQIPLLRPPA